MCVRWFFSLSPEHWYSFLKKQQHLSSSSLWSLLDSTNKICTYRKPFIRRAPLWRTSRCWCVQTTHSFSIIAPPPTLTMEKPPSICRFLARMWSICVGTLSEKPRTALAQNSNVTHLSKRNIGAAGRSAPDKFYPVTLCVLRRKEIISRARPATARQMKERNIEQNITRSTTF